MDEVVKGREKRYSKSLACNYSVGYLKRLTFNRGIIF